MAKRQSRPGSFVSPVFVISSSLLALFVLASTLLAGWTAGQMWPLLLISLGISGTVSSLGSGGRVATGYMISSMGFILLGIVFAQFSFRIVPVSFGRFVLMWWPSFLVAGVICLISAYGYSRYRQNKAEKDRISGQSRRKPRKESQAQWSGKRTGP